MTAAEWDAVLGDIQNDLDLNRLTLLEMENITETSADGTRPGHRAFAFADGMGNAYAVFRGTGSDEEWLDNAWGMTAVSTPQQEAASRFIQRLSNRKEARNIVAAGHSKGGNKAQYAAITLPEGMVSHCLSVDGQGFSPEFIAAYGSEIEKRKSLISLVSERRGFVNCLGLYATSGTAFFSGWRDGFPLPYFHCPDALRDDTGAWGPVSHYAPISSMINALTAYFLQSPKYESRRKATAMDLITLVMTEQKASMEEITEALINITAVFMDLISHNALFRQYVEDVLFMESAVLTDTFECIGKSKRHGGFAAHFINRLGRKIITDRDMRGDFFECVKHLKNLAGKFGTRRRLMEYITSFLERLLRGMVTFGGQ
jgi:hypothetical protein